MTNDQEAAARRLLEGENAQDTAHRSAWEARGPSDSEPLPHCILDQVPRPGDWEDLRRTQRRPDARLRASGGIPWLLCAAALCFGAALGLGAYLVETWGWAR